MGKTVFIGLPHRDGITGGTFEALFKTGIPGGGWSDCHIHTFSSSLLTYTFNSLWVEALNSKAERDISAFCMLHDDIAPDPGWLLTLLEERERVGADILSAVIPIKDERGYTSTAIYDPSKNHHQRITMTELMSFPETFSAEDVGFPGGSVLPNTGLWVCDFTQPWIEEVCFNMKDRIFKHEGKFIAQCLSEDWDFGYWCRRRGLKVMATKKVKAFHHGTFKYPNFSPFGTEKTDNSYGYYPGAAD